MCAVQECSVVFVCASVCALCLTLLRWRLREGAQIVIDWLRVSRIVHVVVALNRPRLGTGTTSHTATGPSSGKPIVLCERGTKKAKRNKEKQGRRKIRHSSMKHAPVSRKCMATVAQRFCSLIPAEETDPDMALCCTLATWLPLPPPDSANLQSPHRRNRRIGQCGSGHLPHTICRKKTTGCRSIGHQCTGWCCRLQHKRKGSQEISYTMPSAISRQSPGRAIGRKIHRYADLSLYAQVSCAVRMCSEIVSVCMCACLTLAGGRLWLRTVLIPHRALCTVLCLFADDRASGGACTAGNSACAPCTELPRNGTGGRCGRARALSRRRRASALSRGHLRTGVRRARCLHTSGTRRSLGACPTVDRARAPCSLLPLITRRRHRARDARCRLRFRAHRIAHPCPCAILAFDRARGSAHARASRDRGD
jgi:hypothetical protein